MKDASPDEKENIEILEAEEFYERSSARTAKVKLTENHEQIKKCQNKQSHEQISQDIAQS
jgi:hypothetical protein